MAFLPVITLTSGVPARSFQSFYCISRAFPHPRLFQGRGGVVVAPKALEGEMSGSKHLMARSPSRRNRVEPPWVWVPPPAGSVQGDATCAHCAGGSLGNFVLYFFPTFMLVFVLFFHFHLQGERPWRGAGACGGWFLRAGAGRVLEGRIDPRVSPGSGRCVCACLPEPPACSSRNTIPMGSFPLHLNCRLQRY